MLGPQSPYSAKRLTTPLLCCAVCSPVWLFLLDSVIFFASYCLVPTRLRNLTPCILFLELNAHLLQEGIITVLGAIEDIVLASGVPHQ